MDYDEEIINIINDLNSDSEVSEITENEDTDIEDSLFYKINTLSEKDFKYYFLQNLYMLSIRFINDKEYIYLVNTIHTNEYFEFYNKYLNNLAIRSRNKYDMLLKLRQYILNINNDDKYDLFDYRYCKIIVNRFCDMGINQLIDRFIEDFENHPIFNFKILNII